MSNVSYEDIMNGLKNLEKDIKDKQDKMNKLEKEYEESIKLWQEKYNRIHKDFEDIRKYYSDSIKETDDIRTLYDYCMKKAGDLDNTRCALLYNLLLIFKTHAIQKERDSNYYIKQLYNESGITLLEKDDKWIRSILDYDEYILHDNYEIEVIQDLGVAKLPKRIKLFK